MHNARHRTKGYKYRYVRSVLSSGTHARQRNLEHAPTLQENERRASSIDKQSDRRGIASQTRYIGLIHIQF